MSQIGNWGTAISFDVSSEKQLPFRDFKRSVSGRWTDHNVLDGKPLSEFNGAGLGSVSLVVTLSADRGVSPRSTIETLEAAAEEGQVDYLYIGGKKIGENMMKLESVSESWDSVWNLGELVRATVTLTFSEYLETSELVGYDPSDDVVIPWEFAVGDEAQFLSGIYYKSAKKSAKPKKANPGPVTITKYQPKKYHPWYIKTLDKKVTKVKGWCDDGAFF